MRKRSPIVSNTWKSIIVDCDSDGKMFRVAVDCDVSRPAKITITNDSDMRVELRDLDNEGVNAVNGRPVLAPGEAYTNTGVPDGTAVLVAYDPGSNERVGGKVRAEIGCE